MSADLRILWISCRRASIELFSSKSFICRGGEWRASECFFSTFRVGVAFLRDPPLPWFKAGEDCRDREPLGKLILNTISTNYLFRRRSSILRSRLRIYLIIKMMHKNFLLCRVKSLKALGIAPISFSWHICRRLVKTIKRHTLPRPIPWSFLGIF